MTDVRALPLPHAGRALSLVERNVAVYRRHKLVLASGLVEPLFYLLSLGVGLGAFIGTVELPGGRVVDYREYVAPAMLAASAMTGAVIDSTYNVFFKIKYDKLYEAVLSTPVGPREVAAGEIVWSLLRGIAYSTSFLLIMVALGLVGSWWAVLVVPAALLLSFAFAAVGMAATTFMRSWQDFDWIPLVTLPLFLLSATFYPLSVYPDALAEVVRWSPLYQGVDLIRSLTVGDVHPSLLLRVAYLLVLGTVGVVVASRRLDRLLLR